MPDPSPDLPRLVVFSDLDGTLLDHRDYSYAPARPALAALAARGIPLVLASSKTAAEIAALHAALGLGATPAIVENGAGLFEPGAGVEPGADYANLRATLDAVPGDLRQYFRGFADMSVDEVARTTGLSPEAATLAKRRAYSEPGLWSGDTATLTAFTAALAANGIAARRGGRFLTLSFGATKADRMGEIATRLGAGLILALGDAPNDIEMLEAADRGVILRNDHGTPIPPLSGEASGRITRTAQPGPAGWNAAVLEFLNNFNAGEAQGAHG
jgi:mannosyl-3-phosphoglycerate phosphatase